jgi:hypothetical protein
VNVASWLIREDDEVVYGDSGYIGIEKREKLKRRTQVKIEYRINQAGRYQGGKTVQQKGDQPIGRRNHRSQQGRASVSYLKNRWIQKTVYLVLQRI